LKKNSLRLCAFACVAAVSSAALAGGGVDIWAVDNLGPTNSGSVGDRVIRFNSSNPLGTVTTIGATGVTGIGFSGLDFDSAGTLYGATGFGTGFTTTNVYTISQTTGAATLVGNTGVVLTDLSWNPVLNQLEGISSNSTTNVHTVYSVSTVNGSATSIGNITGLPTGGLLVGYSIDSGGNRFVQNLADDFMYSMGTGTAATQMSAGIGVNTNFSQGMTMHWSGANEWYLGSISNTPVFASQVRLMNNGTGGTNSILATWANNGTGGLPQYETGDLAINPVPEPATIVAIGLGLAALALRRRK
jgi:hypothetical protein